MRVINELKDKHIFYGGLFIVCLYLSPLFLFGENSLVQILDNLDHLHVQKKILVESGLIFGPNNAQIPNMLNGIPRSVFGTEFDIYSWFIYLFGAFYGYVLNVVCVHLIAFWGMYRLLSNHFLSVDQKFIIGGVATTYGILPFPTMLGLSVAGQAMVLDAFLTIRKGKDRWTDWLPIILVPFYSSFAVAFIFFLFAMSIFWLYDYFIKKKVHLKFLSGIALMTVMFLVIEYRLIYTMFFNSEFVSVRTEFFPIVTSGSLSFTIYKSLMYGIKLFSSSFYFGQSLQIYFILPATIIGVFILIDQDVKDKKLIYLVLATAFLSYSHAFIKNFWGWEGLQPIIEQFSILRTFRFYRFYTFYPLLWYLIFALSLKLIVTHSRKGAQILCILLTLQMGYAFFYHDEIQLRHNKPTYRTFYAKNQFAAIENFIGKNKADYKVMSIGIHPSIALYNGFHTLDGYISNYPLEHKHAFRKIIAKELGKNSKVKAYYDKFGARCYVFVNELIFADWIYGKDRNTVLNNLELNISAFQELGGEYIFSAVKINNHKENQLELLKIFEDKDSFWKIFLYRPTGIRS
jgi:hypothetical protein